MSKNATETLEVTAFLDPQARERVPEIVVAEVCQSGSGAGRVEPFLGSPILVPLVLQIKRVWSGDHVVREGLGLCPLLRSTTAPGVGC